MLLESVKLTLDGVLPSFALGAIGFFLFKYKILRDEGLDGLSTLAIDVTLPLLIFYRLLTGFDFAKYPRWWTMPLLSFAVTFAGILAGALFVRFVKKGLKGQFLSLVSFQNGGYLPLVMAASLLTGDKLAEMLIYLFLFLLGFNLLLFSVGLHMLTHKSGRGIELRHFFSPPVIATFAGFAAVIIGLNRFVPQGVIKALGMAGDTTMPLSMFVVGGNIAAIKLSKLDLPEIPLLILAKMILLPAAGLALVRWLRIPDPLGLLIMLQLAMPPATNLSVLVRQYREEDRLVSQGIFYSYLVGLVTIPLFLSLYFAITMVK